MALTSSTIQVSWHPPEIHLRNGIVKGYKVLYAPRPRAAPSSGLPVPKISRLSTVTTVLENLLKYSNYSIQVLAFTGAGDGLYSVPIDCATHSDGEGTASCRYRLSQLLVDLGWVYFGFVVFHHLA